MKIVKKSFIVLLVFALLIPQFSVFAQPRIEITNLEEFLIFARQCNYDKFSMGKDRCFKNRSRVRRKANINSIPIFCGPLKEKDEISGLRLTGSNLSGHFSLHLHRCCHPQSVCKRSVKPQGERTSLGALLAKRRSIENVVFRVLWRKGTASGDYRVNLSTGTVLGCTVYGGCLWWNPYRWYCGWQ